MRGVTRATDRRRLLAVAGGLALLGARAMAQAPREIEIVARRFSYTPDEIKLRVGERVVLLLTTVDFPHGFNVPELKIRADLMPGKVTRVELQPRTAGTLDFLCDNFCGDGHEQMHGRFLVLGPGAG